MNLTFFADPQMRFPNRKSCVNRVASPVTDAKSYETILKPSTHAPTFAD